MKIPAEHALSESGETKANPTQPAQDSIRHKAYNCYVWVEKVSSWEKLCKSWMQDPFNRISINYKELNNPTTAWEEKADEIFKRGVTGKWNKKKKTPSAEDFLSPFVSVKFTPEYVK